MFSLTPSLDNADACKNLGTLINADVTARRFDGVIAMLQRRFDVYAASSPEPFIAPGVIVTPEIRIQSELYLPIAEITAAFNLLYRSSLNYPPIFSSTHFHKALSWADTFVNLPPCFQTNVNPSFLLKRLLADQDLLIKFLFTSFLPGRFYSEFCRYPKQQLYIRKWLNLQKNRPLRVLDAACGTGEEIYRLAKMLSEMGIKAGDMQLSGWTIEPLEVWAAAHCRFPHDKRREIRFREELSGFSLREDYSHIRFCCIDVTSPPPAERFELILCNGLLGGPIIHHRKEVERVVANLATLLEPGGVLLAADKFHGGWKQNCPQSELQAVFEYLGLERIDAGEGVGGLKR